MTIVIPQQHERDEEQETRQDSSERQKKWSGCGLEVVAYCGNRPSMLTARARALVQRQRGVLLSADAMTGLTADLVEPGAATVHRRGHVRDADRPTYGHLVPDSEGYLRGLLDSSIRRPRQSARAADASAALCCRYIVQAPPWRPPLI